MAKKRIMGLSARLLFFIIPVIVGSLLVSGFLTGLYADRGLERAMSRLLFYKAEDLERHSEAQWSLLLENGLQSDPAYLEGLRRSVRSYAVTMLRGEGEWIFALDSDSHIVFSAGNSPEDEEIISSLPEMTSDSSSGWIFQGEIGGEERVGYGFLLPSLGWHIYITDIRSAYFRDSRLMTRSYIQMIGITVLVSGFFVILFIRRSLKPLKSVITEMHGIMVNRDFSKRVDPIQNDEVGELAREFNLMSGYLEKAIQRLKNVARQEAVARIEIRNRERETLEVLGRVSDHKDPETARHTSRVGSYAALLTELLGDSEEEADLMRWAVPLHDLGKVGIPDAVLLKAKALTASERKIMETHAEIGREILKEFSSPILRAGADIAWSHHERWDGSGYPRGLKGHDIPVRGRITGLVDVFDALTTQRPYKEAWSLERAMEWVKKERERQFDPLLVDLFLENITEVQVILKKYGDEGPEDARESALT